MLTRLCQLLNRCVDGLFPPTCLLCRADASGMDLCDNCRATLPFATHACKHCALPLDDSAHGGACGECLRSKRHFDFTFAVFHYADPLDKLVKRFKYREHLAAGRLLGQLFAAQHHALADNAPPSALIPVPLTRHALARRGFNQATSLAQALGKQLHLPVALNVATRVGATRRQSLLRAGERNKNVRDAFR